MDQYIILSIIAGTYVAFFMAMSKPFAVKLRTARSYIRETRRRRADIRSRTEAPK